jgi:AcrR family transcriptional regulator
VAAHAPLGDQASELDRPAALREQRHRQILDTAKAVFAERGYHQASINEIIGRAGIARGTFYLYFAGKHKVFDSILDEALAGLRARITAIATGPGARPPNQQLRENLERVIGYVLDDVPLTQILLSHGLPPDAESAERVDAFFAHVTEMIRSSLDQGIDLHLVRACDTRLVAAALLGAIRGMIGHLLTLESPPAVGEVVDQLIAFAMTGVVVTGQR